jgi:hypothetical protein
MAMESDALHRSDLSFGVHICKRCAVSTDQVVDIFHRLLRCDVIVCVTKLSDSQFSLPTLRRAICLGLRIRDFLPESL